MNSAAFNAGEFFHGAFEVVTDDVPVIVFAGEDATRPMAERAVEFLTKYTDKFHVIDSTTMSLPGVAPESRAEVAPIVLGSVVSRLAKHFEAVRGHDLNQRRYMTKVDY
jgi:fructoselysine 6-phosphate deglycase